MFYPKSWENTAITLQRTTIAYDGITDASTEALDVRMVFKNVRRTNEYGHVIMGNGYFYKQSELSIAKGDNFTVDTVQYTVTGVYKARTCDGNIEYTRVDF